MMMRRGGGGGISRNVKLANKKMGSLGTAALSRRGRWNFPANLAEARERFEAEVATAKERARKIGIPPPNIPPKVAELMISSKIAPFSHPCEFVISPRLTIDGFHETDVKILEFAQFAVHQHNLQENDSLRFVRMVKASEQLVAGMNYYLTFEATNDNSDSDSDSDSKVYFATVLVAPWEKVKMKLTEWKVVDESFKYPHEEEISRFLLQIIHCFGMHVAKYVANDI